MSQLRKTYDGYRAQLKVADLFLTKYDSKLPEGLGTIIVNNDSVVFIVMLYRRAAYDTNKALTVLGDVFGRADWQAQMNYSHDAFDWSKVVDGVTLRILNAQTIDQPKAFPVNPNQFPIQLAE